MKILAIPSPCVRIYPNRLLHFTEDTLNAWISTYGEWRERATLEQDVNYRQVIPYVVVRNWASGRLVLMRRNKGQGEKRLEGKYSIGAGGHVEENHSVRYTALKEVTEELGLPLSSLVLIGIFYSDIPQVEVSGQIPVEMVHIGVLFEAATYYETFEGPELHLHDPVWATEDDVREKQGQLESWSQIVAREYLLRDDRQNILRSLNTYERTTNQ